MSKNSHRIEKGYGQSLRNWEKIENPATSSMQPNAFAEMGWGRLVFGHTFENNKRIVDAMCSHGRDTRDIAMYVIDPHVIIAMAPDKLFLDPSHTFRLWHYDHSRKETEDSRILTIQRLSTRQEADQINQIYAKCHMKGADPDFLLDQRATKLRTYLVAKPADSDRVVGTITGVDHVEAFNDPENGCSLWSLAVDPQAGVPGVGTCLVRHLAAHYFTKGRAFIDASVMHDNQEAIPLYEKLGFQRVPVFCIKRKNSINQTLYVAEHDTVQQMNPYARLIADEAKKRGIIVDVIDEEYGLFNLSLGSRSITCRESLSEMTSAVAMTKSDDKRLTRNLVSRVGIRTPEQIRHKDMNTSTAFMLQQGRVVVKPARGEQGEGISVDISEPGELETAIESAGNICSDILIETYVKGEDVRIIVINHEVVAAAVRKPPAITGTGSHTIRELIEKHNRRRMAATGGESFIPDDAETLRCLNKEALGYESVLENGRTVVVRKTANLHTGGTIHDVTDDISPALKQAAVTVSRTLDIPVTGLDFMVPDVSGDNYAFIEANERPGLANHEPQPTAQRFIDFLFPETVTE